MQMSSSSFVLSLPFAPIPPSTAKFTPRCLKNCRVVFEKAALLENGRDASPRRPILGFYLGRLGGPSLPKDGGTLRDLLCWRGLGGRQTRNWDAEWTATDVV